MKELPAGRHIVSRKVAKNAKFAKRRFGLLDWNNGKLE